MAKALYLALTLLALAAAPAAAQRGGDVMPLDQVLSEIRRNNPGTFYDAEPRSGPNGPEYRIKWMTPDGRIIWFDVDARSGRISGGNRSGGRRMDDRSGGYEQRRNFRGSPYDERQYERRNWRRDDSGDRDRRWRRGDRDDRSDRRSRRRRGRDD